MNEPTPENNPSNTRKQIAALRAMLDTFKKLDPQEKAEAEQLKVVLDRLIQSSGSWGDDSGKGFTGGGDPRLTPPRPFTPRTFTPGT